MVVVGFACSDEPKIYADASVATDRGSHVGQVLSEDPDTLIRWLKWMVGVPLVKRLLTQESNLRPQKRQNKWKGTQLPKMGYEFGTWNVRSLYETGPYTH